MNNLKTLVEKSREKKALDEFIGAVYKKDGEIKFRFRKDYENLFVPAPSYNEFLGGKNYNGVIAFIIESLQTLEIILNSNSLESYSNDSDDIDRLFPLDEN